MGGGPHGDERFAGAEVGIDVVHLVVGQSAPAGKEEGEVGGIEGLEAGDVVAEGGVDDSGVGIDGKQDRTLEAVMVGEDAAKLAEGFFGAVFVVAGDENDVLALAGSGGAFINHPLGVVGDGSLGRGFGGRAGRGQQDDGEERDKVGLGMGEARNMVKLLGDLGGGTMGRATLRYG